MRIWGRVLNNPPAVGVPVNSDTFVYGNYTWYAIETDANGDNSYCYATALVQCLRLNLNESPFYAQFGLPAEMIVKMQLQPDYFVAFIQSFFAQFFASLIISKQPQVPTNDSFAPNTTTPYFTTPIYNISAVRKDGSIFQATVGI